MNHQSAGHTRMVPERLDKAVTAVRRLLEDAGLRVVDELEIGQCLSDANIPGQPCRILLVDTPVLLFESIALDRAAAVFLPVHIAVCGNSESTSVHWANPVVSAGLRPPAPAKGPLEVLCARITEALAPLSPITGTVSDERSCN